MKGPATASKMRGVAVITAAKAVSQTGGRLATGRKPNAPAAKEETAATNSTILTLRATSTTRKKLNAAPMKKSTDNVIETQDVPLLTITKPFHTISSAERLARISAAHARFARHAPTVSDTG